MKAARLLSATLRIISLFTFGASLCFGWLFYVLYLKWFFRFENGRYFDPVEDVVYEEDSLVLGIISLFLLLFSIVFWLVASKIKSKRGMKFETTSSMPTHNKVNLDVGFNQSRSDDRV